mmetsp:Transcript_56004/g.156076  ORF Transcript_56004/g.156076 Transcript_56004/m.156076 type:complete len:89 (-) Transcript_56004:29-295(-)
MRVHDAVIGGHSVRLAVPSTSEYVRTSVLLFASMSSDVLVSRRERGPAGADACLEDSVPGPAFFWMCLTAKLLAPVVGHLGTGTSSYS